MEIVIKMSDNAAKIVMDALVSKMGELNSVRILSGSMSDSMQEDYELCEQAYDAISKGLENSNQ